jgi:chorismate synthase
VSRLVLRELRTADELRLVQDVARAAWGFDDLALPPLADLVAVTHAGGVTAGAFEDGRLLGFVHGLPRTNVGEPCHHSHMLAVRPEAQGRGLSVRLKLFQRRWCLLRGIRLVTWTYDPLLVKNARLNLDRLGARALAYVRDFYGPMGGIYGRLATDRFEVHWRLDAPSVVAAARARPRSRKTAAGGRAAGLVPLPLFDGSRPPRASVVGVEITAEAPGLYASDPPRAREARLRFRRLAERLFARGYEAVSIRPGPARAVYVFEKSPTRDLP